MIALELAALQAAVRAHSPTTFSKWTALDKTLSADFRSVKAGVHEALCDNVDTVGQARQA